MTYDLVDALKEAWHRLLTPITAVLVVVYAGFGLLLTGATQGLLLLATERWIQPFVETELGAIIDDVRQDDPEAADELEAIRQDIVDQGIAEWLSEFFPYAITTSWEVASVALVAALGGTLVVTVLAYTAYGNDIAMPNRQLLDRIGWKTGNVFGVSLIATLVLGGTLAGALALSLVHPLLAVVGVLVWIPLVVLFVVLALYAPAAAAVDGDNAIGAYLRSVSVVKSNVLATVALLAIWFLMSFVIGGGIGVVFGWLPPIVSTPIEQLVSAAITITLIAFVGTAYAASEQSDARGLPDDEDPSAAGQRGQQPERGAAPGQEKQPEGTPTGRDPTADRSADDGTIPSDRGPVGPVGSDDQGPPSESGKDDADDWSGTPGDGDSDGEGPEEDRRD